VKNDVVDDLGDNDNLRDSDAITENIIHVVQNDKKAIPPDFPGIGYFIFSTFFFVSTASCF